MGGVVINAEISIGRHVIINTGDEVHICPGTNLPGTVVVGSGSLIGSGAAIIPGIEIDRDAMVGVGAAVVRNVPDNAAASGGVAK